MQHPLSFKQIFDQHAVGKFLRVVITPDGTIHKLPDALWPIDDFKKVEKHIKAENLFSENEGQPDYLTIWTPVRVDRRHSMYVNDDGYYLRLPYNHQATALYHELCRDRASAILGTVWIAAAEDVL